MIPIDIHFNYVIMGIILAFNAITTHLQGSVTCRVSRKSYINFDETVEIVFILSHITHSVFT